MTCSRKSLRAAVLFLLVGPAFAALEDRVAQAGEVIRTFEAKAPAPARTLLQKSNCVVVVPRISPGDSPGNGILSCRQNPSAQWSDPAAIHIDGGGMMWSLAGTQADVVLLVNASDALKAMSQPQVIFGLNVHAYPGALQAGDRTAPDGLYGYSLSNSDVQPVALNGATMTEDKTRNTQLYGTALTNKAIVSAGKPLQAASAGVHEFVAALNQKAPATPVASGTPLPAALQDGE